MKIEFDIKDIDRDEIIDAMARQLLVRYDADDGPVQTRLGEQLKHAVSQRIDALAVEHVRSAFDETIRHRIGSAIDAVLSDGWQETNNYGERTGSKLDLKARIGKLLTETRGDQYSRKPSLLQERFDKAAESLLDTEWGVRTPSFQ